MSLCFLHRAVLLTFDAAHNRWRSAHSSHRKTSTTVLLPPVGGTGAGEQRWPLGRSQTAVHGACVGQRIRSDQHVWPKLGSMHSPNLKLRVSVP